MKKIIVMIMIILLAFMLFCGCTNNSDTNVQNDKNIIISGEDYLVDVKDDDTDNTDNTEERTVYTADDIYLVSFKCGYINQDEKPESCIIIKNDAQLEIAEKYYGLDIKKEKSESESLYYNMAIIDAFQKMKTECSFSEYIYVVEYHETSSGMYKCNVDKLIIDGSHLYFELDDESKNFEPGDSVTCDMSGWCYMAAISREKIEGKEFSDIYTPVKPDLSCEYDIDTILEILGKGCKPPFYCQLDHIDEAGNFVIHQYELVNNGDEAHTATVDWITVNPKTGECENYMGDRFNIEERK